MAPLLTNRALETLLEAAILAPSGDNTQPWRFLVDEEARSIDVEVDETRDPSPMNAGQRMARIACGAAIENMVRTAEHNGWPITIDHGEGDMLARLALHADNEELGEIDEVIKRRVTSRHFYDRRPIDASVLARLTRGSGDACRCVRTHWITDPQEIMALADIIGQADAIMFGIREMRRAFLDNIRFDLPRHAEADEGLPTGTLGLNPLDRLGLRLLRYAPDWLVRSGVVLKRFRNRARLLVESAAALCVLTAEDDSTAVDVALGRQLQRRWLDLTECGLAAQPMMSLPVLEGWMAQESGSRFGGELRPVVEELARNFREIGRTKAHERIAVVLRAGHALEPPSRAGRRKMPNCCVILRESRAEAACPSLA